MPDKMPTYRINEVALRSTLLAYSVKPDMEECNAIEQEVANLRFKKSISLPEINFKIVVPVLLLIGVSTLVYFNFDSIKELLSPAPEIQMPKAEVKTQPTPVTNTVATNTVAVVPTPSAAILPPVQNIDAKKQDSILAANKKPIDSVKQNNTGKQANPVMAQLPNDSASKTTRAAKQDTSVQKSDPPVKKKRKRRRRNAAMDDLNQSTID